MLPDKLLEGAVQFHGHLGPFLILGLRAGLLGIDYLGKDYFELKAKVKTTLHPPRSCIIDGIQFISGCTTGKGVAYEMGYAKALDKPFVGLKTDYRTFSGMDEINLMLAVSVSALCRSIKEVIDFLSRTK